MKSKSRKALMVYCFIFSHVAWGFDDPCRGNEMLLALINRPSFAISACTVPVRNGLLETGAMYQNLIDGGTQQNAPNATLRLGLSNNAELGLILPNQIRQSIEPYSGNTPFFASLKTRIYYTKDFVFSAEVDISPPSGTISFGSPHTEGLVNVVMIKNQTKKFSYQLQAGLSSLCNPELEGGHCFQSFNPIVLLNYAFTKKLTGYCEFFEQTKTDFLEGSGLLSGGGFIYLIRPTVVLDIEYYHRVYGGVVQVVDVFGLGVSKLFN